MVRVECGVLMCVLADFQRSEVIQYGDNLGMPFIPHRVSTVNGGEVREISLLQAMSKCVKFKAGITSV